MDFVIINSYTRSDGREGRAAKVTIWLQNVAIKKYPSGSPCLSPRGGPQLLPFGHCIHPTSLGVPDAPRMLPPHLYSAQQDFGVRSRTLSAKSYRLSWVTPSPFRSFGLCSASLVLCLQYSTLFILCQALFSNYLYYLY